VAAVPGHFGPDRQRNVSKTAVQRPSRAGRVRPVHTGVREDNGRVHPSVPQHRFVQPGRRARSPAPSVPQRSVTSRCGPTSVPSDGGSSGGLCRWPTTENPIARANSRQSVLAQPRVLDTCSRARKRAICAVIARGEHCETRRPHLLVTKRRTFVRQKRFRARLSCRPKIDPLKYFVALASEECEGSVTNDPLRPSLIQARRKDVTPGWVILTKGLSCHICLVTRH
jgi:hypothetical protein